MSSFYFCLLAVVLAGFRARDIVTVAGMTERQGRRPGVLLVAGLVSFASAGFAAWAATLVLPILPEPARLVFAAMAVLLAGLELAILTPSFKAEEPTHSLGALAIVLLAAQLTDAARFIVMGFAVGSGSPVWAGLGGAIGGVLLAWLAWSWPELVLAEGTRTARRVTGIALVAIALAMEIARRLSV